MSGKSKSKADIDPTLKPFTSRYQLDKIKQELQLNWGLKYYSMKTRGFYVSFTMSLTELAKIAEKNHRHSANNPYSQFRDIYTLDEILNSPKIHYPLTKLQCCPTSDGAACAIVVSEEFVIKHGLQN